MLEAYATNQTISASSPVPFTSVSLKKGHTASFSGTSSIQLNRAGVYMVCATVTGTPAAAGTASIQLYRDGVAQPQAIASATPVLTSVGVTLPICTLVQVTHDNGCKCCQAPVNIQLVNTGVGLTSANTSIVVTKVC